MSKSSTNSNVVSLARPLPHQTLELDQDKRLRGPDAPVREVPDAAELAAGREGMRRRAVSWTKESAQLRCASVRLGNRQTVHLLVEKLGGTGWDWQVWVQGVWIWSRYGVAGTAENAKEQAEQAFVSMMRSDASSDAFLGPN